MGGSRFVRRLLQLAVMGALVAANDGCLVLSDPDFQGQDECVPFFLTHEADPSVRDFRRIEKAEFEGSVPMRTCALTKPYFARIFLDGRLRVLEQEIPPSGDELRTVPILLPIGDLAPGCHFVEVRVSSAFRPGSDFTQPARPGDIAFLLWTFTNTTDASVLSCGGS